MRNHTTHRSRELLSKIQIRELLPLALLVAFGVTSAASCGDADDASSAGGGAVASSSGSEGSGGSGGSGGCEPGSYAFCYSGPAGTAGVGACKAGKQTCNEDGITFGPCVGEALPSPEVCATPIDDDCDGAVNEDGADCVCVPGAVASCYSGPAGTQDVGLCKAGSQVCNAQGTGFDACSGEAVPAAETCSDGEDNDCDGAVNEEGADCLCVPGSTESCPYSGPPGTEGVGPCKAGTKTCDAMGTAYRSCVGEVVPAAEACGDLVDNDCDGAVNEDGIGCVCVPGSTESCYSGPPGTEGVGMCTAGTKTCNAEGTAYGACMGEVLPAAEDCQTQADESCSGPLPEGCGEHVWSKIFGDAASQTGRGLAVDAAGNVFVTGEMMGSADFGGGPVTSAGNSDVYVAKLSPSGDHLWSKQIGNTFKQYAFDIAVDNAGGAVIVGEFLGTVDFGGGPLTSAGGEDIFVVKLDAAGNHMWSRSFGDITQFETGRMVAVDGAGNVVFGCYSNGNVDFGGGPLSLGGSEGFFLVKLDPAGNHAWSKPLKLYGGSFEEDIAVNAAGDVIITGNFGMTVDFGGGPLTSAGATDVFVAKLDPAGNHVFSKRFGGTGSDAGLSMAVDGAGNLLMTGVIYGMGVPAPIDFGGGVLQGGINNADVFMVKLDASGGHIFSKLFGGPEDEYPDRIAADSAGNVFLAGRHSGAVDFGHGSLPAPGTSNIYAAKFGPSGAPLWSKSYAANFEGNVFPVVAIAADSADHLLLTANFTGSTDFGGGLLTSAGLSDILVLKLAP